MRRVASIFGLVLFLGFGLGLVAAPAAVAAEVLPDRAEGVTGLHFTVAEVRLSPAAVRAGGAARLEVALSPRDGFVWHEADLRPSRVVVVVPDGWSARPKELPLPGVDTPTSRREFTVELAAGADVTENATLVMELDYGVAPAKIRAKAKGSDAGADVFFEEARLTVDLPVLAEPAVPAEPVEVKPAPESDPPPPAEPPPRPRAEGGSPILPALFFALAAVLVLGGVAMA
ncbi:MAG: hypothetical protein ACYTFI_12900, partial [Planctomycetota bacterium]